MRGRRRTHVLAAVALCWAISPICWADEATEAALAEDTGQIEPDDREGTGMVIELDDSVPAGANAGDAAQEPPLQQQELADSEVEMIIGGQGKDGVAKRRMVKRGD